MVTATINGQVVSWANQYGGGTAPVAPTGAGAIVGAGTNTQAKTAQAPHQTYAAPNAPVGSWARQSYYNAANQTTQNLVFLNNMGGGASGTFDNTFGLSLSYATADGAAAAGSAQILSDSVLGDGTEIAVFTGKQCTDDSCGYYRPGSVAYHGFGGDSKLFLLEFSMPKTGSTGFNKDMPAAWILNALIPRTLQYGPETCSCWKSGCGEWDVFEVLESGRDECVATFHGGSRSKGESNYFARPSGQTMKAMVVLDGGSGSGTVIVVDDGTTFDGVLSGSVVKGLLGAQGQMKVAALPD